MVGARAAYPRSDMLACTRLSWQGGLQPGPQSNTAHAQQQTACRGIDLTLINVGRERNFAMQCEAFARELQMLQRRNEQQQ